MQLRSIPPAYNSPFCKRLWQAITHSFTCPIICKLFNTEKFRKQSHRSRLQNDHYIAHYDAHELLHPYLPRTTRTWIFRQASFNGTTGDHAVAPLLP